MSDPLTNTQRAFIAINKKGDLPAAVQLARTVVTTDLLNGLIDDPCDLAERLAGSRLREPNNAVGWDTFCAQLRAALAMGIAIGQLVHPDVFKTKGGRS